MWNTGTLGYAEYRNAWLATTVPNFHRVSLQNSRNETELNTYWWHRTIQDQTGRPRDSCRRLSSFSKRREMHRPRLNIIYPIFFSYRTRPNSTTGHPAELFFNDRLRTRLDLLLPDLGRKTATKQAEQKTQHDLHAEERQFEIGVSTCREF